MLWFELIWPFELKLDLWNSRFQCVFMIFVLRFLDLWCMICFDSNCFWFYAMMWVFCTKFGEIWLRFEEVWWIRSEACGFVLARVFLNATGWRWSGGALWLVHFKYLNYLNIWILFNFLILFYWSKLIEKSWKNSRKPKIIFSILRIYFRIFWKVFD